MITREFNLYLHAGHSIPLVINVNQYDSGEQWLFTLYNEDGTQYTPSTGAIVGIKSDNLGIINSGTVDASGRVVINETQQMTAAVGKAVFELLIDDQTHGTANFIVLVEPKPGDNADLNESDLSLIQQAIDGTSAAAIAQGVSDWMDENLTPTTPVVDASLTVQGAAADSAKVGQELSDLKSQINNGLPREVKLALNAILHGIPFIDDDVYSDELAVFNAWATAVSIVGISAVFDQGDNIILSLDSLDSLKQYLTVTAEFDDGTTSEITTYTLSGDLTEGGECTITVSYSGQTTTFVADVTEAVDVTPALSTFVASNRCAVTVDSANNSIRVYTTSNTVYSGAQAPMPVLLKEGYTYKVSADVTWVKGTFNFGLSNASTESFEFTVGASSASGHYEKAEIPSTKTQWNENAYLRLCCVWATNGQGDCTFTNLKVIEYLVQ